MHKKAGDDGNEHGINQHILSSLVRRVSRSVCWALGSHNVTRKVSFANGRASESTFKDCGCRISDKPSTV